LIASAVGLVLLMIEARDATCSARRYELAFSMSGLSKSRNSQSAAAVEQSLVKLQEALHSLLQLPDLLIGVLPVREGLSHTVVHVISQD
jgi:hypothetical protein